MSLFSNAETVAVVKPTKAKAKPVEITIAGMEKIAAIDALIKALEGVKETEQATVKSLVVDEFVESGCRIQARPANFRGIEGIGSASCELRARSSRSTLSAEEIVLLQDLGIPVTKVDTVEECFRINPAYLNDSALLERVSKAIEKVKDVPGDFIQKQEGVTTHIVGEGAFDILFKKSKTIVRQMLETVGVIALKPKLEGGDLEKAITIVRPLLGNLPALAPVEDISNSTPAATPPRPRRKAA